MEERPATSVLSGLSCIDSLSLQAQARAMKEIIFLVEDSPEGGYEARALGHSIFTDGDDLEQLKVNVKDAVATHFDAADQPKVIRLHMVKEIVIAA
jgi:hypothetical protein